MLLKSLTSLDCIRCDKGIGTSKARATLGEGLYEGLDWLSGNIASKVTYDCEFVTIFLSGRSNRKQQQRKPTYRVYLNYLPCKRKYHFLQHLYDWRVNVHTQPE